MALPADAGGKAVSPIAGSVFPVSAAEELLSSLAGVLSSRIVTSGTGQLDAIHVLTSSEIPPKQTVRNVESALMAHFGMKIDHRKISVATTVEPVKPWKSGGGSGSGSGAAAAEGSTLRREVYFEDVEVRRSRASGMSCRVTIRQGEELFVGEATGLESDRLRIETSARAAVAAVQQADSGGRSLVFEGAKLIDAFEREFVFVALTTRFGRETALLTGSAEVKDGIETASVLAVLDATNRWVEL